MEYLSSPPGVWDLCGYFLDTGCYLQFSPLTFSGFVRVPFKGVETTVVGNKKESKVFTRVLPLRVIVFSKFLSSETSVVRAATSGEIPGVDEFELTLAVTALFRELQTLDLLSIILKHSEASYPKMFPPAQNSQRVLESLAVSNAFVQTYRKADVILKISDVGMLEDRVIDSIASLIKMVSQIFVEILRFHTKILSFF
ncbi:hypothetical protein Tco_0781979 [Tanacetum coccineum]